MIFLTTPKRACLKKFCGYLAGTNSQVVKHFRLTNIDHSNEHFSFDPKEAVSGGA